MDNSLTALKKLKESFQQSELCHVHYMFIEKNLDCADDSANRKPVGY